MAYPYLDIISSLMDIEEVLNHAQMEVQKKQELFLRLCALNYLNALVKEKEYKGILGYWMIKPKALQLAIDMMKNGLSGLYEEIYVKEKEDCLYIRCYGLQFSFHHVNVKVLADNYPELCNADVKWDGVKLQSVAGELYSLANEMIKDNYDEVTVKDKINTILRNAQLQN